MPKEGARRNACGRGDFLGRHRVVAAFDEQPERRSTNVGPDLRPLPIAQTKGIVKVPTGPGLGIEIDREVLKRYKVA